MLLLPKSQLLPMWRAVATSGLYRASIRLLNPHFSFTAMETSQQILHGQAVERIQGQSGETNTVMRQPQIQQQSGEAVQMTSLERNSRRIAEQTGNSNVRRPLTRSRSIIAICDRDFTLSNF